MADEVWRAEADDRWLAERRSGLMGWLRRRFRLLGGVAGAVSHADTGPYAGAPRNPRLGTGDEKTYSTVRYSTNQVTNSRTVADSDKCRRCGEPLVERHQLEYAQDGRSAVPVGAVRVCRGCQADSWLLRSRMPGASRARDVARKNVV
ncbi:hypothetical protein AB0J86_21700 [Micromonospora sp. NPDC049559]|uniref:hypothetical protein n=1 Tax=Micromonospora sp. NPDC049559 TaxID=3155923 RepID=UPI00343DC518